MSDGNGVAVPLPSNLSVDDMVGPPKAIIESTRATVFTIIDHGGEATKVGMKMPPIKRLVCGEPRGGTPDMLPTLSIALDLPLKTLVSEGSREQGRPIDRKECLSEVGRPIVSTSFVGQKPLSAQS